MFLVHLYGHRPHDYLDDWSLLAQSSFQCGQQASGILGISCELSSVRRSERAPTAMGSFIHFSGPVYFISVQLSAWFQSAVTQWQDAD